MSISPTVPDAGLAGKPPDALLVTAADRTHNGLWHRRRRPTLRGRVLADVQRQPKLAAAQER
ncbi:MAG TPA: hypothetical protein VIG96_06240 [Blastococcus sp.]